MKNFHVMSIPEEVVEGTIAEFRTDFFKTEARKEGSLINQVLKEFSAYPKFFADLSAPEDAPESDLYKSPEWAHFAAYMGGLYRRPGYSDLMHDIYMLHEMKHAGSMTYRPELSFKSFKDKMIENEAQASVTSEIEFYLHYPEKRAEVFQQQEIFADRYLNNPAFLAQWKKDPQRARDKILLDRNEARNKNVSVDLHPVEGWIHKFDAQNDGWCSVWAGHYNKLETAAAKLHAEIDAGKDAHMATKTYMDWLNSPEITEGTEVPFNSAAIGFDGIYRNNRALYDAAVKAGKVKGADYDGWMRRHFPGEEPKDVLKNKIIPGIVSLPHYSTLETPVVKVVETAVAGSFAIAYAENPENAADPFVIIQRRSEKGKDGAARYGALGGFTNFSWREVDGVKDSSRGESPAEGAAREITEEMVDADGKPVIAPAPDRFLTRNILAAGHDYRRNFGDVCTYTGYALPLTPEEVKAIDAHIERTQDAAYAKAATEASHGEVDGILKLKLSEVLVLGKEQFFHPHEFEAVEELAARVREQQQEKSTIAAGNWVDIYNTRRTVAGSATISLAK
jgi:hypothetical protein